jgi:hypothetical protein
MRYGLERLARDAAAAGIDGCLLTDAAWKRRRLCRRHAPPRPRHRLSGRAHQHRAPLKLVARYSTGFVYLVSRTGVTGERDSLSDAVGPLIRAVRAVTDLPLAVGFGISKPEHVFVRHVDGAHHLEKVSPRIRAQPLGQDDVTGDAVPRDVNFLTVELKLGGQKDGLTGTGVE